jgi:2-oxoglutarate ferredoxin oxidoreductase subunit delta
MQRRTVRRFESGVVRQDSREGRKNGVAKGRIEIDEMQCKGCELCISVCPKELLEVAMERLTPKGYHPAELVDPDGNCTGCAICAVVCPEAAITVYRMVAEEQEKQKA